MLILGGLLVSLFVPRRRMWVKAVTKADGRVVLEYAALARGEDPGLEDAVTGFADKHAGHERLRVEPVETRARNRPCRFRRAHPQRRHFDVR
ncbi:cytochrome c biogenesis protein ResB [Agromyces hippuratus]|uniref:cytochrome c biogenesis protein ResB n=1 Tax=Agromyces hippuratus TaxID=286438 RepID=UPI0035EF9AB8